jgi:AraC-like DNA-binding protein
MCKQLLEARRVRVGTATLIRHYLSATSGSAPFSLEEMARLMNISTRTLKRRLQDEGTTFRTLLDESRGAMAEALLGDDRLTLSDIAQRLGFSDLSSFSQAFKRRYGVAPRVYRAGMLRDRQSG